MYNTFIKKLIARNGERELIDSSFEERQDFIFGEHRPDFNDEQILCVKFLEADNEDMECAEETSWFVNPFYVGSITMTKDMDNISSMSDFLEESSNDEFSQYTSLQLAAEFLPEVLIIQPAYPEISVLIEYERFHNALLKYSLTSLSREEKFELFLQYMKMDYSIRNNIIANYTK